MTGNQNVPGNTRTTLERFSTHCAFVRSFFLSLLDSPAFSDTNGNCFKTLNLISSPCTPGSKSSSCPAQCPGNGNCNGHGICYASNGTCVCTGNWTDDASGCIYPPCPGNGNCSGHGACLEGSCTCTGDGQAIPLAASILPVLEMGTAMVMDLAAKGIVVALEVGQAIPLAVSLRHPVPEMGTAVVMAFATATMGLVFVLVDGLMMPPGVHYPPVLEMETAMVMALVTKATAHAILDGQMLHLDVSLRSLQLLLLQLLLSSEWLWEWADLLSSESEEHCWPSSWSGGSAVERSMKVPKLTSGCRLFTKPVLKMLLPELLSIRES